LERLAELRDHEQIAADALPSARGLGVALNTQVAPLNDRRVRLALNHAIDKPALAQSVYQGQATVLGGPVSPHVFGAYPQTPFTYDPSRARALLSEAGYPAGLELPLLSSQGRQPRDAALARALQQQLQAVGIRPRLELADHAGYVDATTKGLEESGLRISLIGWLPNTGEIREALFPLFHSSQWPPSGFNTSFLRSPRLDEALEQGSREIEPGRRERQFWQAQELVREEAPWIFLLSPSALVARSRRLHEPHLTTTELVSVSERTWLE
jgi:ABC-type transport system substrate-binding protein